MENIWYAVQKTSEDAWDYGSHDYDEAVQMLLEQGNGLIAVINEGTNVCEREITFAEVADYDSFRVSAGWESGCTIDNDIICEIGADAVEAELKDAREWFDEFFEHKPDFYLVSYYMNGENIREDIIR